LFVADFLSLGFHGLALFYIFGGLKTLNRTLKDIRAAENDDTEIAVPALPPQS
jgi:hypothetical protein